MADTTIITNQTDFLATVFEDILPASDKLYFLVGYFYFSGFQEIYSQLADKELKILVGMNIERDLANKIREFYTIGESEQSRLKIKQDYFKSLVEIFNNTDFFDNAQQMSAFEIFYQKIQNGSLEIRKTQYPNHAKMYLFQHLPEHSQGGRLPGTMITGSSNLSISGLKSQHEINVVLYDKYKAGKEIFDALWNDAIDIVSPNSLKDFTLHFIQKIWYEKLYSPYLFYIRVLDEYFSYASPGGVLLPSRITRGKYFNLQYQTDAIKKSLKILEEHGGVLISDVVGLGKSIIASAVAYNLRKKVIIIAPPHLHDQWDGEYRMSFELNAKVFGSGSIHKALEYKNTYFPDEEFLIIVDEAHKYRNEYTDDYILLHRLCQGNKVLLLSATPFNNRPQDVFAMIKLFQIPSKSTIRTVANLSYHFAIAIREYKAIHKSRRKREIDAPEMQQRVKDLASQIRLILEPVVIRRSRLDLDKIESYRKDLEKQNIRYVFAEAPKILDYKLGNLESQYISTLFQLSDSSRSTEPDTLHPVPDACFIGTRYKPVDYIIDLDKFLTSVKNEHADVDSIKIAQTNLAQIMQKLLVGRFESSLCAFQKTLKAMIISMENIRDYYQKLSRVPIFKKGALPPVDQLLEDISEDTLTEIDSYHFEEELKKQYEKGLVFIEKSQLKPSYIIHLQHDLALLKRIYHSWFKDGIGYDPKLQNFKTEIMRQLADDPTRKIIVFSEYADTAHYIYENICHTTNLKAIYYSSQEVTSLRRKIKENFDASLPKDTQKNDYDLLICTDALSEGVNLNRAGTVFNYDIPYNPTRVIQRVGRINRIGTMIFDKLYIYNYFPSEIGEGHVRIKEISTLKKAMIDVLLGEDTRVLTSNEELISYFHEQYNQALLTQEAESWDAKYINEYEILRSHASALLSQARQIEPRSRLRRSEAKDLSGVLVFGKKGKDYTFRLADSPDSSRTLSTPEALALFAATKSEKPQAVSQSFDALYQHAKNNLYLSNAPDMPTPRRAESLNKIKAMQKECPSFRDYLNDLYFVGKELNSLPERVYYHIDNKIDQKSLNEDIKTLMDLVPHSYLNTIIQSARRIEDSPESLILSEELI
ncbi:MAG: helicase-related protein [Candidatus Cloacimonetes bacterium]|nr:helicase-related protein [Candidatus Cloacimonadota bacterium]